MNRYGNFNFGSVQSQSENHESQGSTSIGSTNPYSRRDSLSHEPNMEYSQRSSGFSRISAAATRVGRSFPGIPWTEEEHKLFLLGLQKLGKGDWRGISRNFVKTRTPTQVASHARKYFLRKSNLNCRRRESSLFDLNTDSEPNMDFQKSSSFSHTPVATQMKKNAEKLQLSCDSDDSENTDIQNFIRTLQGCTYSNNIELDKEDSSNQLESLKLTLALPIPKDNTHIQNENTSTSIKEPNMDFQKSSGFSHTLAATQMKKNAEKLQLSCDSDDSKNTNIQNFIPTLQECTYSNNIELDKEDSSKQLESLKLTLALPIPKDNTHIQNANTSTTIEVPNY